MTIYNGPTSQITSLAIRPKPIPKTMLSNYRGSDGNHEHFTFLATSFDGIVWVFDTRCPQHPVRKILPINTSPWALSACWNKDGSKIYCGRRNGTVDEIGFEEGTTLRVIKLPTNSGPVSSVLLLLNGTSLLWYLFFTQCFSR